MAAELIPPEPPLVVGFVVIAAWFAHSAMPYRVPLIVDGASAELRILHIQKNSLHFEESAVFVTRNGKFFVDRTQRRLLQYSWETRSSNGVEPTVRDRAVAFADSPELRSLPIAPARQLWSWNAEGWYVVVKDRQIFTFTSADHVAPPREIVDLFRDIQKLAGGEQRSWTMHDVCLGFAMARLLPWGFNIQTNRASC